MMILNLLLNLGLCLVTDQPVSILWSSFPLKYEAFPHPSPHTLTFTLITSVLLLFLHFSICNIIEDQITINIKIVNEVIVQQMPCCLVCFVSGGICYFYGLDAVDCESHWIEDGGLMAFPEWKMPGQLERALPAEGLHPEASGLTRTLTLTFRKIQPGMKGCQ